MNDEQFVEEHLDEYLDGELDPASVARVAAHLESCPDCRAELDELVALRRLARGLPAEIVPRRELWEEIRDRIVPEAARMSAQQFDPPMVRARAAAPGDAEEMVIELRPRRKRDDFRWRWLAAAAVLLVALSSGTTAYLLRNGAGAVGLPAAVVQEEAPALIGLAAFEPAGEEYSHAVEMLEAELDARRADLLPETVAAVEANLAIIDTAISEARAALAADPTSADLPLLLSEVYRRKVELLQRAVTLSARS